MIGGKMTEDNTIQLNKLSNEQLESLQETILNNEDRSERLRESHYQMIVRILSKDQQLLDRVWKWMYNK
jgi:hypothetical protein